MRSCDVVADGSFNVRDLGGYAIKGGTTRSATTLRGGGMDGIQPDGIETLRQYEVVRVIDLRSAKETAANPDPFNSSHGIDLQVMPLFDDLDPTSLKPGHELLDLYITAFHTRRAEFVQILQMIADTEGGALFHCTAGKDRTGLIAAMLLSIAGVSKQDIIADYGMTAGRIGPLREKINQMASQQNIPAGDLTVFLECPPDVMAQTLEWLQTHHGGALPYLSSHGLTDNALAHLRQRL